MKVSGRKLFPYVLAVLLVVVIAFGILSFLRMPLSVFGNSSKNKVQYAKVERNVQVVSIDVQPEKYEQIVVQKGVPVRFIMKAESSVLNSCNSTVVISRYGIKKVLKAGENTIEFTPRETGVVPYSCKMGMIKSKIIIVDNIEKARI